MDVRLSPEQQALRDSVVQVVDRLGPTAVGQLDDAERVAKLDAAVAASGWRELRTADDSGQAWASGVEAAIVAEELARGLADVPYLGPTLAAELARVAGVDVADTVVLTSDLGALGRDVAVDAAGATTALTVDGGDVVRLDVGSHFDKVDLTRPSAAVAGDGEVVGSVDADALQRWTAFGLALTCADLIGAMDGVTRLTTEYAKERRQYGAPIGSFQAVQHLLADAFVLLEGSRSVALHAAWAADALPPTEAVAAGALAKAYCARAGRTVCETAIQVHGGIGNTWECLAHVYLRRALLATDVLGGVDANLDRVLVAHGISTSSIGAN